MLTGGTHGVRVRELELGLGFRVSGFWLLKEGSLTLTLTLTLALALALTLPMNNTP